MRDTFLIRGLGGKKTLTGHIFPRGAKNAVLKALAAVSLFEGDVSLYNVPDIADVRSMCLLMKHFGTTLNTKTYGHIIARAPKINKVVLDEKIAKNIRASVVLTGPLLARYGQVSFPHPGGCVIGKRPIDLFISGFQKMGARVVFSGDKYTLFAPQKGLRGAYIFFENISVTATETLMLAAVLARGVTVLSNAALEPEIYHLAKFLNSCGANILGAGTPTITIKGGKYLRASKQKYITPPDRIETGSFLILGALCARNLIIDNCIPEHVMATISLLQNAGVDIVIEKKRLIISNNPSRQSLSARKKSYASVSVKTHEYPGFPTDLQAPMAVFLTQARGEAQVFETIFEGRLNYVESLNKMGADIISMDRHRVLINGPTRLSGKELVSPDLRAGLGYIIAALVAKGTSVIHNANYIDRGYEKIDERLRAIGADIKRIKN